MKTRTALVTALILLAAISSASGSPVMEIPYTKKTTLTYPATYTIRFSLCATSTLGANDCVWSEEKSISLISNANIKTNLGDTNKTLSTVDFSQQYYVQVDRKKGDGTYKALGPTRDMFGVVPYSMWSATSDSVFPGGCTPGQVMVWTGEAWVCQTVGSVVGPRVGYYTVAAAQFVPDANTTEFVPPFSGPETGARFIINAGSMGAALILPEGAQITDLAATFYDGEFTMHSTVTLWRVDGATPTGTNVAQVATSDLEAGPAIVKNTAVTHTVSLGGTPIPHYWLRWDTSGSSANLGLYNVRVTYTYTP